MKLVDHKPTETVVASAFDADAMKRLLEEFSGDCYLEYRFSKQFAEIMGRPETEILGILRTFAREIESTLSGRKKYERAMHTACTRMWYWFMESDSYNVASLVTFIGSHNPACVYCVLVGKAKSGQKSIDL